MNNNEFAKFGANALLNKKATDVKIIDIREKATFADYLIIATGTSDRQINTLTDEVEDKFAEAGLLVKSIEGKQASEWVLMDFGDIIVNLFTKEAREKFNLEKVWGDCDIINVEEE